MKLRAAVVGCGSLANGGHLPALQKSEVFDLVATCDRYADAAEAAAARWGAKRACTDWHDVTAAGDVDLIVLCTHTNLRGELICEALRRGKPVYTEKPLATSRAEMLEIFRAVRETGVPVCVGHNRRSSPAVLEFKRLMDLARQNGADRAAIIDRNTGRRDRLDEENQTQLLLRVNDDIRTWKTWIFEDEQGIILAEMVHFIDLALWLIPSAPVEAFAIGSPRGNFTEIIRFRDGSAATLHQTMVGNFDYPKELFEATLRNVTIAMEHHVEVRQRGLESEPFRTCFPLKHGGELSGKQGIEAFHEAVDRLQQMKRAACRGGRRTQRSQPSSSRESPAPLFIEPNKGHVRHLESFGLHVLGKGENPCPVESAIVVTNIALKLLESVRLGLPVKIGPEDCNPIHSQRERGQGAG